MVALFLKAAQHCLTARSGEVFVLRCRRISTTRPSLDAVSTRGHGSSTGSVRSRLELQILAVQVSNASALNFYFDEPCSPYGHPCDIFRFGSTSRFFLIIREIARSLNELRNTSLTGGRSCHHLSDFCARS